MTISLKDLTEHELRWLKNLHRGGAATLMLPADTAARLRELGLAEQKLGGTGISKLGKRLIDERIVASRRARGL
ncbi:hypothetical protein ABK249_11940 [Neorhizobium sp. Rsf11]|uniref:Uncharacterized protein n=1 Tax=Neorhizobium phenanthreniclasticum TaxID=3157917 RepID=A0ABV0M1C5_9HYPH